MILLAGPNGAGKTSLYETQLARWFPGLPFINADRIAAVRWPDKEQQNAYEAARIAANLRDVLISEGRSFITETVFSHPSKLDLIKTARARDYEIWLLVVYVDADVAVERVLYRMDGGGHTVPEDRIRARHRRLLRHLADALPLVQRAILFDNNPPGRGHLSVAHVHDGHLQAAIDPLPPWAQLLLKRLGRSGRG